MNHCFRERTLICGLLFLMGAGGIYLFQQADLMKQNISKQAHQMVGETILAEPQSAGDTDPVWNITFGGSSYDTGRAMAIDSEGNTYLVGETRSFEVLGQTGSAYLAKFNPSGVYQWNRTWGTSKYNYGKAVEVDSIGNIYMAGFLHNQSTQRDAFLVKYNSHGDELWNTTWGAAEYDDELYGIGLNDTSIYITGHSEVMAPYGWDVFLVKYDVDGNWQWNTTWGDGLNDNETGRAIAVDSDGFIYVTGYNNSNGLQSNDAFLTKFDYTDGSRIWERMWGLSEGGKVDEGYGIAISSLGNITIVGATDSFGQASGYTDGFAAHFDSDGNFQSSQMFGESRPNKGLDIAYDEFNNYYVAGYIARYDDPYAHHELELYKFNRTNAQLWNRSWGFTGSNLHEYGYGVALNGSDYVYVAGETPSIGAGGYDAVLIKYRTNEDPDVIRTGDETYLYGSTGHTINWAVIDLSITSPTYTIRQNGSVKTSDTWISGDCIIISTDDLWVGYHNFSIIFTDGFDGFAQNDVIILVTNENPEINNPNDQTYEKGSKGNLISWTITDTSVHIASYVLQMNGSVFDSGAWISAETLSIDVDGLDEGEYSVLLIAQDGVGGSVQDKVSLKVIPSSAQSPEEESLFDQFMWWIIGGVVSAVAGIFVKSIWTRMGDRSKNVPSPPTGKDPWAMGAGTNTTKPRSSPDPNAKINWDDADNGWDDNGW